MLNGKEDILTPYWKKEVTEKGQHTGVSGPTTEHKESAKENVGYWQNWTQRISFSFFLFLFFLMKLIFSQICVNQRPNKESSDRHPSKCPVFSTVIQTQTINHSQSHFSQPRILHTLRHAALVNHRAPNEGGGGQKQLLIVRKRLWHTRASQGLVIHCTPIRKTWG